MNLKRLASLLTASTICIGVMKTLGAYAASTAYDVCDVNHDGSVSIMDVITINKYLLGAVSSTSSVGYNQLDANQSLIVDAEDSQCVIAKIVGLSYSLEFYSRKNDEEYSLPSVSSSVTLDYSSNGSTEGNDNNTNGIAYRRYSYIKGTELSSYTLKSSEETISSQSDSDGTDKIIGSEDTRYRATGLSENTGIVYLKSIGGTGFIVDDHTIATAAHCVYSSSSSSFRSTMTIMLYDEDGCLTSTKLTPVEVHVPEKYTSTSSTMYDYALITVAEDLSDCYHFNLGNSYNVTASNFADVPIYVTGRPGEINVDPTTDEGTTNTGNYLYTDEGKVYSSSNTSVLYYTTDTSGGDSGAPVYVVTKSTVGGETSESITVIAIHHGGTSVRNVGSLITQYHIQFYYNNSYVSYSTSESDTVTE